MSDLFKRYDGNASLMQSSYEVDYSDSEYHLYRCLSEGEITQHSEGAEDWRLDGNRLYLLSRKKIEEIEAAVNSYWDACIALLSMSV
jgi:hypothetical protein